MARSVQGLDPRMDERVLLLKSYRGAAAYMLPTPIKSVSSMPRACKQARERGLALESSQLRCSELGIASV